MRFFACFCFVTVLLVGLWFGNQTRFWGGLFVLNLYWFIAYLSYQVEQFMDSKGKLPFSYAKFIAITLIVYTVACFIRGSNWTLFNKDITATIIGIGFVAFLVHTAFNHKK